ncbi:MAG: Lrp/AsnC family transcriptional regulator [Alphaproteobacteria bacterium]|nr:Lrp/AsnC family transcriptional regulator [Alphaproteobacteria bacterium]
MDTIDKAILAQLQHDSGTPVSEISESVGLSATPCWRRIKKLEEEGVIARRTALIDPAAVNLNLTAFVAVKTAQHSEKWLRDFSEAVRRIPEVVELHRMSGDTDYLMKLMCPDMAQFDRIYKQLISIAEFSDVSSTFSMERLKHTTELPLDYI